MSSDKKIEDVVKELEPQFKALKAIFENPEARREYERKIQAEASERKAKEISWLDEQRKKIEHVDAAVGLQEKVYDLARQMGLDKDDFDRRLDKGEFDNVLFYSGLKEHVPFFETKLKEKTQKKSEFERKGMDVHLKYLKEGISDLNNLLDSLKRQYNPKEDYLAFWIKVGSDYDIGLEKITEIYRSLAEIKNKNPRTFFRSIFTEWGSSSKIYTSHYFERYIESKKYLPEFEILMNKFKSEREHNEKREIYVSVRKIRFPWTFYSGYVSVKDMYTKSSVFSAEEIHDGKPYEYRKRMENAVAKLLRVPPKYNEYWHCDFKTEKFQEVFEEHIKFNKLISYLNDLIERLKDPVNPRRGFNIEVKKDINVFGKYIYQILEDAGLKDAYTKLP